MTQTGGPTSHLSALSLIVAMVSFAALQYVAYVHAGWVFQYPLDDPYIHMAIAEQMRAGGYGVNEGEYAAAASSVLFPALLLPFAGTEAQRYMPLLWNTVGLAAAAYLWGRVLFLAGYSGTRLGLWLAILAPLALNMVGLAFTGMEHALHLAASLAIVVGLIQLLDTGRLSALLGAGVLFAPVLRFEGLALALLAAAVVMLRGRIGAGLGLAVLAVAPVVAFALYLMSLGLDPLPSSITAKLSTDAEYEAGLLGWVITKLSGLIEHKHLLLSSFLLAGGALFLSREVRASNRVWLLGVVLVAGTAHLLFAKFGWMHRYEIYILATLAAGILAIAPVANTKLAYVLPAGALLFSAASYVPAVVDKFPISPRAIQLQQGQMARFAKVFLQEPVAVNDLGLVAWQNPDYVLDLWGLANHEARQLRLSGDQPQWADGLAKTHNVKLAMVYQQWFADGLGEDWVPLGSLILRGPRAYLGAHRVQFLLTDPIDPTPYVSLLKDWQAGLPDGVVFEFAEGLGQ